MSESVTRQENISYKTKTKMPDTFLEACLKEGTVS